METIITDKITFGGNCLAKINGKAVFVPFAIPGETLDVEITEEKRDYCNARIVKIENPSPFRQKPVCPLYEKCGGCNMMHIQEDYQRVLRKEILKDSFLHNGIELKSDFIEVISGNNLNYRSRIQLNNGGFCGRKTNEIIPIDNCFCAVPEINEWLLNTSVKERGAGRSNVFGSKNIISAGSDENSKVLIAKTEEKVNIKNESNKKNKNFKQIKKHYMGTTFSEDNTIRIKILNKEILFDVRGFFQSNIEVLEKSIEKICSGLFGSSVLDMYAGCGTFSVFLADKFKDLTLVEHNRDALVFAEMNLSGIKHQAFGLSGEKWVNLNRNAYFDAVVIDPPRSGIEKEVLLWLSKSNIPQIRSVSCDPATHARDIKVLLNSGYELKKLYLLDFYPNTSHIESLAILEKTL